MPLLPKMFLDTNVCSKLRDASFAQIRERINRDYQVVVSANTFAEVLHSIKGAQTDEHLQNSKNLIRIMTGNVGPTFLDFPDKFALQVALRINEVPVKPPLVAVGPQEFSSWFEVVMNARDLADLLNAEVRIPDQAGRFGLDFDLIDTYQKAGKRSHRIAMEQIRDGKSRLGSSIEWATMIAQVMGCYLSFDQHLILAYALDAAYTYEAELCKIVRDRKYNFVKHDGDWIDMQQLFYLADPNVWLLTADKGIRERCKKSDQSKRILLLNEM